MGLCPVGRAAIVSPEEMRLATRRRGGEDRERPRMLKRLRTLFSRRGSRKEAVAASPAPLPVANASTPVHHGPRVVHQPIDREDLDLDAVKIVERLTRFDHGAYFVGGCVRDLLLGRHPKDFDIGTSATPRQIKRLFRNCRIIGRRFRLAHIYFQNGKIIEVATFRALDGADGNSDGAEEPIANNRDLLIRDDNVFGTPEEDALRRDFTINALFYDVNNETVLDYADGLGDLRRRLIRTIGDPETRFREDPIRILRAIKFAARLDFGFEAQTGAALRKTRNEIPRAAMPRILEELVRFCRGGASRQSFELMRETGVFDVVLPELREPYAREAEAWPLLVALLGQLDVERQANGREASMGELLSWLLMWPIARRLGWTADGKPAPAPGAGLDDRIDEFIRPIAVRLRISRRDQEIARQTLASLFRMFPARTAGRARSGRRESPRRGSTHESSRLLAVLAERFGGEAAAALSAAGTPVRSEPAGRAASPAREAGEDGQRPRRRRRGGRGRGRGDEAPSDAGQPSAARATAAPAARELPPPWDDRYFFAALPSVPEIGASEDAGDRYGAAALEARTRGTHHEPVEPVEIEFAEEHVDDSDGDTVVDAENGQDPGRRKRRRGRRGGRRRRRGAGSDPSAGGGDSEGGETG